jgi:hypothetical protein
MNPPTTLTNNNPPATPRCGLNPNPICREESETPHSAASSGVVIFTTGTFFFTVIPLCWVSWWTPEPCQTGTDRGGITTSLQQNPGQPPYGYPTRP